MLDKLKEKGQQLKDGLKDYSCTQILRIIGLMPKLWFPLFSEKISVPFWILHIFLSVYVYFVGVTSYTMRSIDPMDAISSVFNFMLVSIVLNGIFWWLTKRKEINSALELALLNDALVKDRGKFLTSYRKLMKKTKILILICLTFHFVNDVLIYTPTRIFYMSSFSTDSCVGLEPITASPNREICMLILAGQEMTSMITVGSYDVILIFMFSHTTTIFFILRKDVEDFSKLATKFDRSPEMRNKVNEYLRNVVNRHSFVLLTVNKMQGLFSIAISMVLFANTISVCFFFVLPLEAALSFAPLIAYTFTLFFLYCLQGQRLINASLGLEMAVYSCGWENLHPSEQRVVLLMLIQAQKPVVVCAGMVPICLSTFLGTVQSIYKFISVFRV